MKRGTKKPFVARKSGGMLAVGFKGGQVRAKKTAAGGAGHGHPHHTTTIDKIVARQLPAGKMIGAIEGGLRVQEVENLRSALDMPMEKLATKLGISKATLHRRKSAGKLDPAESDRVVRFARLLGKAVEVLESGENARKWLASPQIGLGGAVPLDYARTEVGAREVEDLLGRIEYGVYS